MKSLSLFTIIVWLVLGCAGVPSVEVSESRSDVAYDPAGRVLLKEAPFSGYLVSYYPDATMKKKSGYLNGLKEGPSWTFHPDGSIRSRRTYLAGEKHGTHRGYHENGARQFKYHFENGLSVGTHEEWYDDGSPARLMNYVEGRPFGTQKVWRPDGKLRSNYVVREDGRRYGLVGIKRCKNIDTEAERIKKLSSAIYAKK
ncbi:toxin-antitoxin system YwqK family antitoxin [Marinoscillum furvescens]|uniref:MORN repeat protein n=1 Tax=Marinoscillum furvescens DSM 4134 TaxID=1122208 RepID=A0A3D9LG42_MARFU|nr:hypothetical protein [Marinoscillum furvescens]REE05598.1 MORN repeat protein [Marinoscillum furvescens DSM 4134]